MIAPYLQACNSIALCWIQKPSRCHINENYNQCLPQKNCITPWYHLNLKFVAKRQRTITEFRNLSAAEKKFRKVDKKSSRYFIHSKFARSETASNTTSTTCGCTIPVWWNSVKPPVTHWLKGDFDSFRQDNTWILPKLSWIRYFLQSMIVCFHVTSDKNHFQIVTSDN